MKTSLAVASVLIGAYGLLLGYRQMEPATPLQMYWKKNRNTVAMYLQNPKAPVVFTGSSLTVTLEFNEANECVYNLGLIGESALTGIDIISDSEHKPSVVFVEVNFPGRESNKTLIKEASGFLARNFPEFTYTPPISLVGNMLASLHHLFKDKPPQEDGSNAKPDPEEARKKELTLQLELFNVPLPPVLLTTKIDEFRAKVKNLENNGVRVVFFEMPVHPDLENSNQAVQVRTAFRSAFPDNTFIGFEELANGVEVNPADGLHLNVVGATGVIRNLKSYYVDSCT